MKNKRIIILCITAIVLIVTGLLYFSYGYYMTNITGAENSKKLTSLTKIFKFEFSDGTEKLVSSNTNFIPGSVIEKTFTITNKSTEGVYFNIDLDEVTNTFSRTSDIIYEVYYNNEIISTNTFPTTNASIATNLYVEKDGTRTYTLKVKYLNSDENQISDIGKSISASIVFGRTDSPKTKFNILGNSYQEISNGKNLFTGFVVGKGLNFSTGEEIVDENAATSDYISIDFETNPNYMLSGLTPKIYSNVCGYDENKDFITCISNSSRYNLLLTNSIFNNTSKIIKYIKINQKYFKGNSGTIHDVVGLKVQLEVGKTSTVYEKHGISPAPDNPSEIVNLGSKMGEKYKINIKSVGKNIFNADDFVNTYSNYYPFPNISYISKVVFDDKNVIKMDGGMNIEGRSLHYMNGFFKDKTSYTFSFDYYDVLGTNNSFGPTLNIVYTDGSTDNFFSLNDRLNNSKQWRTLIFTSNPNKTINYINTSYGTGSAYTYFYNFQIEEGQTRTDYEFYNEDTYDVYLNEPLRCVGDICDYIDLINKKVVRKIGRIDFINASAFYEWKNVGQHGVTMLPALPSSMSRAKGMSNRVNNFTANNNVNNSLWLGVMSKSVYWVGILDTLGIYDESKTEQVMVSEFDEWLSNHPTYVIYQMSDSTEESISLPDISNFKDRTLFVTDGNLNAKKVQI